MCHTVTPYGMLCLDTTEKLYKEFSRENLDVNHARSYTELVYWCVVGKNYNAYLMH